MIRFVYTYFLVAFTALHLFSIEYVVKNYSAEEGLSDLTIRSLYQDNDGLLWIGTSIGLNSFDGYNFTYYNLPIPHDPAHKIPDAGHLDIVKIIKMDDGSLLLLDARGKIWKFMNEKIHSFHISGIDTSATFNFIMQTSSGRTYFAVQNGGLAVLDSSVITHYHSKEGLLSENILSIFGDDDELFLITDIGVNLLLNNNISTLFSDKGIYPSVIVKSDNGDYWCGVNNQGIYRLHDGNWSHVFKNSDIRFYDIQIDSNTEIWIAADLGLFRIILNSVGETYVFHDIKTFGIRALLIDKDENKWAGSTGSGLFKLSQSLFYNITSENGFPAYYARPLFKDSEQRIWISAGNKGGVTFNKISGIKYYGVHNGLPKGFLFSVTELPGKRLLLASGEEIVEFRNKGIYEFKTDNQLPAGGKYCVFYDSHEQLWASVVGGGIWRLENNKWKKFHIDFPSGDEVVRMITEDDQSNIWFCSRRDGVFKFDGKKIIHFSSDNGLVGNFICTVADDPQNRIWVGTLNGINIIENDKITDTLTIDNGLVSNKVYAISKYKNYMLLGTAKGFGIYDQERFNFFNSSQGLTRNDISDFHFYEIGKGSILFGTVNGFSIFQIESFLNDSYDYSIKFTSAITENDTLSVGQQKDSEYNFEFNAGLDYIKFQYQVICFKDYPFNYRYLVKKNENDSNWVSITDNEIVLENCNAGIYKLVLEVKPFGRNWEIADEINFKIGRSFFQSAIFYFLIVVFIGGFGAYYYIYSRKKKLEQKDKYYSSSLSLQKRKLIKESILKLIEFDKGYKNPDISLQILTETLKVSKEHISQVINSEFKCNFNDFINKYRIEEAKRMLTVYDNGEFTIIQIAYEVGFNSKSSFNTAFKKFTSMTPSQYKKQPILSEN